MVLARAWWIAAAALALASPAAAEDFDNGSVIALTKLGVGKAVLLAKVASLPCAYDVSTNGIVALKGAGVSDAVIAAMVDRCTGSAQAQAAVSTGSDPSAMRSPGLYIDLGIGAAHRLEKIRPTNLSGGRMTGNGSMLFPFRLMIAIPREAAPVVTAAATPSFYFYFETDNPKVGDFGMFATRSAQSPSEFSLVRFKRKDGQREASAGRLAGFSGQFGISPKEAVQFSIREIRDGIFAVAPAAPLSPGEYGFVLQGEKGSYRIYDFQVSAG